MRQAAIAPASRSRSQSLAYNRRMLSEVCRNLPRACESYSRLSAARDKLRHQGQAVHIHSSCDQFSGYSLAGAPQPVMDGSDESIQQCTNE